jgi:Tol biopolymer transport system component
MSVSGCGQGEALSGPAPPALLVTTATSGDGGDPDGYTVAIDGHTPRTIGVLDSLLESSITPGNHTIDLAGLAGGCAVEGGPSRVVTATVGTTVAVDFTVICTAPEPPQAGGVRVTVSTSGVDLDADGYIAAIDPMERRPVDSSGEVLIEGVPAGAQSVRLSGLAANCSVQGDNPLRVEVPVDSEVAAAFIVRCWPPATGRIVFAQAGPGSNDPSFLSVISADGTPIDQFEPTPSTESPSWSPDGNFIAFNGGNESFEATVRVLPTSGAPPVQLPGCFMSAARPAWSPDGARLLCLSDSFFGGQLFSIRRDGTSPSNLSSSDLQVTSAHYVSNGQVIFAAEDAQDEMALYRAGTTSTNFTLLFALPADTDFLGPTVVPSPDGSQVTYIRRRQTRNELWVANIDGSLPHLVSSNLPVSSSTAAVWSPDASRIAFKVLGDLGTSIDLSLWMVNPDGSALTPVPAPSPLEDGGMDWSPDGSRLVFAVPRINEDDEAEGSIYIVRADGSGIQRLTASATYDLEPAWAP